MSADPNQQDPARETDQQPATPTLSVGKRRLFITLSVLFPFMVLLAIEGGLRLAGYGGYPPTLRELHSSGGQTVVITDTVGAATYFDQSKTGPGSVHQFTFVHPKPAANFRVVLVGGSAIKGFPQPRGFAPSAFLEVMLQDLWPEKQVEVINLGTTAVASFPALDMLQEMMPYEPDLVVIYTGHNEFFGAYGVASRHFTASAPWAMKLTRQFGGTGIGQFTSALTSSRPADNNQALMEAVVGQASIARDGALRSQAADNLQTHISEMIRLCQKQRVPVIVCTLASNERDFAPVGRTELSGLSEEQEQSLEPFEDEDPESLLEDLEALLEKYPDSPLVHYRLGTALAALRDARCAEHFQKALDLDRMPWRAPSQSIRAIRNAANSAGVPLCDVQARFRSSSELGTIGHELMDDHVHPSLKGQWLIARSLLETMAEMSWSQPLASDAVTDLGRFEHFAQRLGDNGYDRLSVLHALYKVFDVPFIRASNASALREVELAKQAGVNRLSAEERLVLRRWEDPKTHPGFEIPLSGMMATVLMGKQRYLEAERLFNAARGHVPTYSGPYFEYTTFALACRQTIAGVLDEEEEKLARQTLEKIELFLQLVEKSSGQPERFMGRLHQLLGEHEKAIERFVIARALVSGDNLVKVDMALVASLAQTGKLAEARKILTDGIRRGGATTQIYQQVLRRLSPSP